MDTTRISLARVLALDVPLTWQDAVAVAQEAAMLSDVHAAMNSRPSLVSAETCFITRTGDLELPVTTEVESPDAVSGLLREMLAGRDAPEALETLAFGHATRDLSGALQRFPITNRRAEIAKLATRALALQSRPLDPPAPLAAPAITTESAVALPSMPVWPQPQPPAHPQPLPQIAPPELAASVAPPPSPVVPFVRPAPFRAATAAAPRLASPAPVAVPSGAPEAELRRLRSKSVARAQVRRTWSARVRLAFDRLARMVSWRPSTPDPRILGAAFIITAAVVSVVWTTDRPVRRTTPAAAALKRAPAPAVPGPSLSAPTAGPAAAAVGAPNTADAANTSSAPAPGRGRRAAGAPVGTVHSSAVPVDAASVATSPAATAPAANAGYAAARGPTDAPLPAPRAGVTVTLPALDPVPGPLVTSTTEPRAAASARRAESAPAYSAGDDDVVPPVLLRQQLPSPVVEPPSAVPDDWPYLELVIDRNGAVEQVRLRAKQPAPGQTLYRHRMLLAAAKAWQFEPARRRGAPVRYVMRVPLEP